MDWRETGCGYTSQRNILVAGILKMGRFRPGGIADKATQRNEFNIALRIELIRLFTIQHAAYPTSLTHIFSPTLECQFHKEHEFCLLFLAVSSPIVTGPGSWCSVNISE